MSEPWDSIDDVPLDAWFRGLDREGAGAKVDGFGPLGLRIDGEWLSYRVFQNDIEWSLTPKTGPWYPCDKEHAEKAILNRSHHTEQAIHPPHVCVMFDMTGRCFECGKMDESSI